MLASLLGPDCDSSAAITKVFIRLIEYSRAEGQGKLLVKCPGVCFAIGNVLDGVCTLLGMIETRVI